MKEPTIEGQSAAMKQPSVEWHMACAMPYAICQHMAQHDMMVQLENGARGALGKCVSKHQMRPTAVRKGNQIHEAGIVSLPAKIHANLKVSEDLERTDL